MSNHTSVALVLSLQRRCIAFVLGAAFLMALPIVTWLLLLPKKLQPAPTQTPVAARLQENYGQVPLHFEANQGQFSETVKYLSRGKGYSIAFTPQAAVLELQGERSATVQMKLKGSNPNPRITNSQPLDARMNYFLGNDSKQWRRDVPTYGRVKYERVYPGVDLVYYGNQQELEYDFVVAPGADPSAIKVGFNGAERLRLDEQGNLVIATAAGEVIQHKPILYQEAGGKRQEIAGDYVLQSGNEVSFSVGEYDASRTLVIDPVLSYATYATAASQSPREPLLAVDKAGHAYVISYYNSNSATPGALNQGVGFALTKFSADGSQILYTAVIGGSSADKERVRGITVDPDGNAYLVGTTASTDFPTTSGVYERNYKSPDPGVVDNNSFLLKLNPSGTALVFSTYFNGKLELHAQAVGVDAAGNVIVTGASGGDLPTTPNAYKPTIGLSDVGAPSDAFVAKFNPTGSALIYSTYLGGSSSDGGKALAVDAAGNAYVMGTTNSNIEGGGILPAIPFPTTPGAYEVPNFGNIFLTKFDANGNVVYSALPATGEAFYFGGVAVDDAGNAYLGSMTRVTRAANNEPVPGTPGAFQLYPVYSDYTELNKYTGFVTKLSPDGSERVYATYLGGPYEGSSITGIAVDKAGCVYVSGEAKYDFPLTSKIFPVDGSGLFVAKLNATGTALVYSAKLSGNGETNLGLDAAGNAYVTGFAGAEFQPTANAAIPLTSGNNAKAFLVKIAATTAVEPLAPTPARVWDTSTNVCNVGGRVTDENGNGIEDVQYYVTGTGFSFDPHAFEPFFQGKWFVEPNGLYSRIQEGQRGGYCEVNLLPRGGTFTITPYKPGYKFTPATQTVSHPVNMVAVSFKGKATTETVAPPFVRTQNLFLAVRVLKSGSEDVPAVGATVTLSGGKSEVGTADSNGAYLFTNLAPNTSYTVTVSAPGNATQSYTFSKLVNNQSYVFKFQPPPPRTAMNVSAASYTPSLAVEGIASAFGEVLATTTATAITLPLPTTLGGTRVRIRDASNRTTYAPLFFVSPTQVNYQIPKGVTPGLAYNIIIESADGTLSIQQYVQIDGVAPGLFSANASGKGVAAAQVQRVKSDGTSTWEAVSYLDFTRGQIMAIPIDLSSPTDQCYLVLYGTGVRGRSQLNKVTAKVGGTVVQTTYAGSQNSFAGLDQINIMLPRGLAGRGEVDVELSVDGKPANVVRVKIK